MISAITLGWEHGSEKATVILGPEIPITEHNDAFYAIPLEVNEKFSRIEVWTSFGGRDKIRRYITPAEKKRQDDAQAAAEKKAADFAKKAEDDKAKEKAKRDEFHAQAEHPDRRAEEIDAIRGVDPKKSKGK